ncbi:hypothetical protein COLO4_22540 [Corchorus olitorius]|uniref:Poly A polymerase head domain-containing protein n=1 Tax=Corchorus olitorius TaxID=93759 RepID=A0A1R3ILH0_9ROSI|nr:hypothetical protein COLO4_22540 [Corchorus olitorius]
MAPAPNPALYSSSIDTSKWKKIQASNLGITRSMISVPSWIVLNTLHKGGFEAYLVGGCVRDLLLRRIPKDFDVITTATLKEIKKKFHRAQIVGKRFPICMVHIKDSVIEVSSFETVAKHDEHKEKASSPLIPNGCDEKDIIRWRNSLNRDFTINSLFFDPIKSKIYDYNNGMSDLKSLKLRTLITPHLSFQEDCARILRGLRIAARLGLSFSKDTESAMQDLASSIEGLDKFRLMLEVNYMLSYGSAESSICLLHRFKLLKILLPFQAEYIKNQRRSGRNVMMLMKLFFNLDKLVSCDRPADPSLWVALLMFHLALVKNPQDALVVSTFGSVLHHGKWKEGVKFAREHTNVEVKFAPEISGFSESKSDEDLAKEVAQFASLVQDSVCALTETSSLIESTSTYPFSKYSGLVFVPKRIAKHAAIFFGLMVDDIESFVNQRRGRSCEINYHLLGKGDPCETRYVLGKIILETMMDGVLGGGTEIANVEKELLQPEANEKILENNQRPMKKDKSRAPSIVDPEAKQGILKKPMMDVVLGEGTKVANGEKEVFQPKANGRDLANNQLPLKEDKKRAPSMVVDLEGKQGILKKQKLVDRNQNLYETFAARKKQEVVTKEEVQTLIKKQQKLSKTEGETNLKQRNMSEKEKSQFRNQEKSMVKKESHKNDKEKRGRKHSEVSKKEIEVVDNGNLREDVAFKWQTLLRKEGGKEEVKEKTEKDEGATVDKKGRLLSSLFK